MEYVSNAMRLSDPAVAGAAHIGRIETVSPNTGKDSRCTGFMISRNHALTAAHCFVSMKGIYTLNVPDLPLGTLNAIINGAGTNTNAAKFVFNQFRTQPIPVPPGTPQTFYVDSIVHLITHQNDGDSKYIIDAALVKLSTAQNTVTMQFQSAGDVWGYFDYYSFNNFRLPTHLYRAGVGIGTVQGIPNPFYGAFVHIDRSSQCRIYPACRDNIDYNTRVFAHECDTYGGDSGGPLIDYDTGIAFGINISSYGNVILNGGTNIRRLQYYWDQRAPWGVFDATENDL